jgi:hypothetical protein
MAEDFALPGAEHARMRQTLPVKRYALARSGIAKARPEEGVRRLRLVRMEAIAERDRARADRRS